MLNLLKKIGLPTFALAMIAGIPAVAFAGCLVCTTVTSCPDGGGACKNTTSCKFSPLACPVETVS